MTAALSRLAEIEALAAKATPGPYTVRIGSGNGHSVRAGRLSLTGTTRDQDAAYIAALDPATVLAMVAALRAAIAMREDLWAENSRREAFDAALARLEEA